MIQKQVNITTNDGQMVTFIAHPERDGPHPVILFYMDAPGFRSELRDMARRLASAGYYVMLPNLYYRSGELELGPLPADPDTPERRHMSALMNSINIDMVMADTEGLLAYAEQDQAADETRVGAVGYCMSGRYAINAAGRFPEQVKAAASVYGTHLVTGEADSPDKVAREASVETYFACAEIDRWAPLDMVHALRAGAGPRTEVEIYPAVEHGFAFPKRHCYDRDAAETHWERLHSLFRRNLS